MMVPSQPISASRGSSSKCEIPPEAMSCSFVSFKIFSYNANEGPVNIPSLLMSVQIVVCTPRD